MKPLPIIVASALALATAACAPGGKPVARTSLDCPARQGGLSRVAEAADQKSCAYANGDGDEVSLRLIPVTDSPQAALQPIEAELQAEAPPPAQATGAKAKVAGLAAPGATDADRAEQQAAADSGAWDDQPTGHRHRRGQRTEVDLPGLHVSADDNTANVHVGMIDVDAGDDGAVVRMSRNVRLRGESLSLQRRGFRATYILARDNLKDGYKAVGYEAAGPRTGPLTVAVVKSRSGEHHDIFGDVKRLVRRNGGV